MIGTEIRGLSVALWNARWLILLTVLVAATTATAVASFRPPVYRLEARAEVLPGRGLDDQEREVQAIDMLSTPSVVGTFAQLFTASVVQDAARQKAAVRPADASAYAFQARPEPGTMHILLTATGPDPVVLAAYTNATLDAVADAAQAIYGVVEVVPLEKVSAPGTPASPNMSREIPLAGGLGLVAGLLIALAAGYLKTVPGQGPVGILIAAIAAVVAGGIGVATAFDASVTLLAAVVVGPFALLLALVRPSWAVPIYGVLVYADLLSILTRYHGVPPLARFFGIALLAAALCHRLLVRSQPLARDGLTWWLLAYGVMVAAGLLYARDAGRVVTNLIEYGRNMLTYFIVLNTATTAERLRRIVWAILAIGVLLAALTLYQSLTGNWEQDFGGLASSRASDIVEGVDAPRPGGTINDANYYGLSLLILVPIGFYLAWGGGRLRRLVGALATATLVLATIFTYSRGDAVALGAILVAVAFYKRLHPLGLVGLIVVGVVVIALLPANYLTRLTTVIGAVTGDQNTIYNESSLRGRAGALEAGVGIFLDHPLFGVGRENYDLYQADYLSGTAIAQSARGIPPHNFYLEVAAEHGLVGVAVVGGLLLATWRAVLEARGRFLRLGDRPQAELVGWLGIALLGYLVGSLFLHGAFIYLLWLQLALLAAFRRLALGEEAHVVATGNARP